MPYKRKPKSKKPRKRYRRGVRSGYSRGAVVSKQSSPMKRTFKAGLKYCENSFSLNPSLSGAGSYVFSANGLYDPNITGVGHQPSGFDQLMLMYDHYTVIGARMTCTFVNTDTTYAQQVAIVARDAPTTQADIRASVEAGTCVHAVLSPAGGDRSTQTLVYNLNPNKFLGRSKPLADSTLKGTAGTNPSEQVYFHLMADPGGANDSAVVNCKALIEYTVIFHEPKEVGLS